MRNMPTSSVDPQTVVYIDEIVHCNLILFSGLYMAGRVVCMLWVSWRATLAHFVTSAYPPRHILIADIRSNQLRGLHVLRSVPSKV